MKFSFLLLICCFVVPLSGQGFDASILGGISAAQIDGDDLAGFNKLGLHGGLKVGYFLKPKLHLSTELLYSQRGSSASVSFGSPIESTNIDLKYLELPVIVSFMDWYVEDSYHKVRAEVGLSYAYQFQASAQNSFFEGNEDLFATSDVSFLAGLAYRFNERLGVNARYTRSIIPLFNDPNVFPRGLFGYFVTFRVEYHL